jgi:hypothetical protein
MHYGSPIPPKTCASSNRGYAKNLTRDKIDRNKVMGRTSPEKGGAQDRQKMQVSKNNEGKRTHL